MASRCATRPHLVIAGPGAGKTYDMVQRILAHLPSLAPHRYLAAITFTNAAANTIRDRLRLSVDIAPNVFVGTIHGFLNRFVLSPFATIFKYLPEDRVFGPIEARESAKDSVKAAGKKSDHRGINARSKGITSALLEKGIVPYDEIVNIARDLLSNEAVRKKVCLRLQYLLIDEFQDTDLRHFDIFEHIRKMRSTDIYAVGDPEQYVYGFTYGQRGIKAPAFTNIPFFRLREKAESKEITINRRSCQEIVGFANHFSTELKQESGKGSVGQARVLFLPDTDLRGMIRRFREHSESMPIEQVSFRRLYLSRENGVFEGVRREFGIACLAGKSQLHESVLKDALEFLAFCSGMSQKKARETLRLSQHKWRQWGLALIREIRDERLRTPSEFIDQWLFKLRVDDLNERRDGVCNAFEYLQSAVALGRNANSDDWASSIHKAKGLEATSVLAVASRVGELEQWLETDHACRKKDKSDQCRLGFVAFSRARELLCIACMEPIACQVRLRLADLGVAIVGNPSTASGPGAQLEFL